MAIALLSCAVAPLPMAMALSAPPTSRPGLGRCAAVASLPIATEPVPDALAPAPMAVALMNDATALLPIATELSSTAFAPAPMTVV